MIKIKVLYFAQLSEAAGVSEQVLERTRPLTVRELAQEILLQPQFESCRNLPFRYAVNDEFVDPETKIENHVTMAMIPPVAGG